MMVLVTYDVSLQDVAGAGRLRRIAKICRDYGQRVQFSVFEIEVDPGLWAVIRDKLIREMQPETDSLRFYFMGSHWERRVEHVGAKPALDLKGPLVF